MLMLAIEFSIFCYSFKFYTMKYEFMHLGVDKNS